MKWLRLMLMLVSVFLIATCGSDNGIDQNRDDPGNIPGLNDSDSDGVINDLDLCPESPSGEDANENGCTPSQLDDDHDGVSNAIDICPNTPDERAVNDQGCHTPEIGEFYQGGFVFYIFKQEDYGYVPNEIHGLIMAPYDLEESIYWASSRSEASIQVFEDYFGYDDGLKNTNQIMEVLKDSTNAAGVCYTLDLNNYDDWYLPSLFEGRKMSENLTWDQNPPHPDISQENRLIGYHWLSNESQPYITSGNYWVYRACFVDYISPENSQFNDDPILEKTSAFLRVRPIRRF